MGDPIYFFVLLNHRSSPDPIYFYLADWNKLAPKLLEENSFDQLLEEVEQASKNAASPG
jgi:hypothetical protein